MDNTSIYQDIAKRTNGDIYIGVVGPVRTGKSTFIKKFMDILAIPNIKDENEKQRVIDELPQPANGKTVMTTKPQFVPNKGVKINLGEGIDVNIRLIDCVGYMIDGMENQDRMVQSPWKDEEIPFAEAGELGTKKVMSDHSTIGVVVTTDGSVSDFDRKNYLVAEERIILEMKKTGKPFIVLVNSKNPDSKDCKNLAKSLAEKYSVCVLAKNISNLTERDIQELLGDILGEFPLVNINVNMPKWIQSLPFDNALIAKIYKKVYSLALDIDKMKDYNKLKDLFCDDEQFEKTQNISVKFDDGSICLDITPKEELFYSVLSDCCGVDIKDETALFAYIKNASTAINTFDKMQSALKSVDEYGYGVVLPNEDEIEFASPEFEVNGNKKNVKMTANCSCLHIMKIDVATSVNPIVATGVQAQDMVNYLESEYQDEPKQIWQTNMFGKKLSDIAKENLQAKMFSMPEEAQNKLRKTVCRIVNEGKGGVLCVLL